MADIAVRQEIISCRNRRTTTAASPSIPRLTKQTISTVSVFMAQVCRATYQMHSLPPLFQVTKHSLLIGQTAFLRLHRELRS